MELAITQANEDLGKIPQGTAEQIRQQAGEVDEELLKRISEIEAITGHVVQSFVDAIRERLDKPLQQYFHQHTTSTDTTETAQALIVSEAIEVILETAQELSQAVKNKAEKYRALPKIGRTHTQHGAPSIEGLYFLWWHDTLIRRCDLIAQAHEAFRVGKIRGLVGTYDQHITPALEQLALGSLGLKPVKVCGQIILRDRLADLINNLAVLGGLLENMAVNIRLGAQTEIGEFSNPSRQGAKVLPTHRTNETLTGVKTLRA